MRLELGQSLCAGKLMFLPQNLYLYYASYTQIVLLFIVFADELYPLLPYLLRHYPGEEATHDNPKWIYNYRHGKCSWERSWYHGQNIQDLFRKVQFTPEHMEFLTTTSYHFLRNDSCKLVSWKMLLHKDWKICQIWRILPRIPHYSDDSSIIRDRGTFKAWMS